MPPLWEAEDQLQRLQELMGIPLEAKEEPLRRDIRSLGTLLGGVIKEKAGNAVFAAVEDLRRLSIEHRKIRLESRGSAPDHEVFGRAAGAVRTFSVDRAYKLTKAFAIYFELTNLAETNHRKRRRRAAGLSPNSRPQSGTFKGTLERMKRGGLSI